MQINRGDPSTHHPSPIAHRPICIIILRPSKVESSQLLARPSATFFLAKLSQQCLSGYWKETLFSDLFDPAPFLFSGFLDKRAPPFQLCRCSIVWFCCRRTIDHCKINHSFQLISKHSCSIEVVLLLTFPTEANRGRSISSLHLHYCLTEFIHCTKMSKPSSIAQQVSHWIHDEQACVTVQRILQTFDLSWEDASSLLKEIPEEGRKYSVTSFAAQKTTADKDAKDDDDDDDANGR